MHMRSLHSVLHHFWCSRVVGPFDGDVRKRALTGN